MNDENIDYINKATGIVVTIMQKYEISDPQVAEALSEAFHEGVHMGLEVGHETAS